MSTRKLYLLSFVMICGLLLTSLYLQFFQGVEPCPLCSLQRITFAILGIFFFIGIFAASKKLARYFINGCNLFFSLLGIGLAGRQIWLQHFPSSNTECGVSLQYMMEVLPWHQVAQKILEGSTECAQRNWEFLTLSMAEWALIWFVLFLLLTLFLLKRENR